MSYVQPPIRVFVLSVNGNRKMFQDFLDSRREVLNWFGVLANTLLVASRSDVTAITDLIHRRFPYEWFILSEIDSMKTNGFINKAVWDFLNNPKSSGRWE